MPEKNWMKLRMHPDIEDIQKKARSESMNKWIRRFKKEFKIKKVKGSTPTRRMENTIRKLHKRLERIERR